MTQDQHNPKQVPELLEDLRSQEHDESALNVACLALGKIGAESVEHLPVLIAALGDEKDYVRGNAATVLGQMGPAAEPALPALIVAMNDRESCHVIARAVARIGAGALPHLINALQSDSAAVRLAAAAALMYMGRGARGAVSALMGRLRDHDSSVRAFAAAALRASKSVREDLLPALVAALDDENAQVREHSAEAISNFGPAARSAVPRLIVSLTDEFWPARCAAAGALESMGKAARAAVPSLVAAYLADEELLRKPFLNALRRIDPQAADKVQPEQDP